MIRSDARPSWHASITTSWRCPVSTVPESRNAGKTSQAARSSGSPWLASFSRTLPILILDEGTSALDNISEQCVQQAINAARADRTVILVAHRLTTLRQTDRILVFEDGRIVETGTYSDLVQAGGVFAELVKSAEGTATQRQEREPDRQRTRWRLKSEHLTENGSPLRPHQ